MIFTRKLGRSGIEVSAMGMGCWAIGGPWTLDGGPAGWSQVDDAESLDVTQITAGFGGARFGDAAEDGNAAFWLAATDREVLAQSSVFDYREEAACNHHYEGDLLLRNGRPREAERAYRQALELYSKLAADYPGDADYRRHLATVLTARAVLTAAG